MSRTWAAWPGPIRSPAQQVKRRRLMPFAPPRGGGGWGRRVQPGYTRRVGFYKRQYGIPNQYRKSKALAQALGVEKKFTTDSFLDATVADSWTAMLISVTDHSATESTANMLMIAHGNGQSQRIGRKIMVTKLSVRWNAQLVAVDDVEAAPLPVRVRLVFYIDKQCNGTALTSSDLFADTGPDIDQYRNLANAKRFKILKDFEVTLKPGGGAGDGNYLILRCRYC